MIAGTANDAYGAHTLFLKDRKSVKLTGVCDAISFDEQTVILDTESGRAEIGGEDLHVEVLNLKDGVVELSGRIDSIFYDTDNKADSTRKGFFAKLFR